jgi:hypothetical protein
MVPDDDIFKKLGEKTENSQMGIALHSPLLFVMSVTMVKSIL